MGTCDNPGLISPNTWPSACCFPLYHQFLDKKQGNTVFRRNFGTALGTKMLVTILKLILTNTKMATFFLSIRHQVLPNVGICLSKLPRPAISPHLIELTSPSIGHVFFPSLYSILGCIPDAHVPSGKLTYCHGKLSMGPFQQLC